jgi:hypothetical protein
MNRVTAVTATLVTAAAATVVVATVGPAMAAPHPTTARSAAHAKLASSAAHGKLANFATEIGSELQGGKYATVVQCHGVDSPPPVQLAQPGTPLTVDGVGPSAAIVAMLKKPNAYKTIYACTVVIEEKAPAKQKAQGKACEVAAGNSGRRVGGGCTNAQLKDCEIAAGSSGRRVGGGCTKPVTLNTGFGGMAKQVKNHHPAS